MQMEKNGPLKKGHLMDYYILCSSFVKHFTVSPEDTLLKS